MSFNFILRWHAASSNYKDRAEGFEVAITTRLLRQLSLLDRQTSVSSQDEDEDCEKWGYWALLPVSCHNTL